MTGGEDHTFYRKLADSLRQQIEDGEFKPDTPMPSIDALKKRTGLARQTISRALGVLESEGLIVRVPGHSYYVESD
jgi:DNA-binding GntR family transcriptional regulator